MRFSCERCGKKYATADKPAPGRVYKLKCKACGHLIVVRASASAAGPNATAAPEPRREDAPEPRREDAPAPTPPPGLPDLELDVGPPEPDAAPPGGAALEAAQPFGEPTTEISMVASVTPVPAAREPERPPPLSVDSGYVDLFSDVTASGSTPLAQKAEDPFLAAARASLPEGYGSSAGAPDPFAPLRDELAEGNARAAAAPPPAAPKIPVIPKPPPQKSHLPIVGLMGLGVAVLIGITAFAVSTAGKKAAPVAARAAQPPVAQPLAPAPVPAPPAEPPLAAPAPATAEPERAEPETAEPVRAAPPRRSDEERRAREERRRKDGEEAQAREARERDARERDRAERERRAREERAAKERAAKEREARDRERQDRERLAAAAAQEEAEGGLSQAQIEGVLRSTKKAFDACIGAARAGDAKLDGRRVMLRLNIQTSGTVTYPTLDDVTLNGTELGACLKSAARLMVFPKFKGDTLHVEVPLVVR